MRKKLLLGHTLLEIHTLQIFLHQLQQTKF